jgi:hypothetical protein
MAIAAAREVECSRSASRRRGYGCTPGADQGIGWPLMLLRPPRGL